MSNHFAVHWSVVLEFSLNVYATPSWQPVNDWAVAEACQTTVTGLVYQPELHGPDWPADVHVALIVP
ncbi:MAG: hypothetical protein WBQ18_17695 [Solirubrobacteraceae bacterium]